MAKNHLTGNVRAPSYFGPLGGKPANNIISGSLHGDGTNITNVARVTANGSTDNLVTIGSSAQRLVGEPNLKFNGSRLYVNGTITGSSLNLTGLSAGTATTSSYLALDANNNVVLTSSAGGSGGTIGPAEDGDYDDGLYTDFTPSTPIGTPIDRFNEVLKILAPTPAPVVKAINEQSTDGVTAKLSFGSSFPITGYTSSGTQAGFDAVDRSGSYGVATSGSNFRLGIYSNEQNISGTINYNVAESVSNGNVAYASGAFGNGETGTLKLELNGTVIHSVDLSSFTGAGNPGTGSGTSLTSGSGFVEVSVSASSFDGNGAEWYIFKHRTAKYEINSGSMKTGWNYLRVIHTVGSTDNATNYIEWINDPSGAVDDLEISNPRIEDITLVGSKYLSGVQYNTNATAEYRADILNLYRNVYAASGNPISFSATNSSTPSAQSVPDIGPSEDNTKVLGITGSLDVNADTDTLFSGSVSTNVTVTHPLKATISNTGSATTGDGFLIDNRTLASTNLIERFHDESLRKTSGSYSTQGAVDAAASIWDSENHMTGGGATGHTDGLLFFNQRLYSPVDGDVPAGGNFSSLLNVESGQPDYSGVTGTRTFYRVLTNSSGVTKRDFKITSTKNSSRINNSSLSTQNINFFAKIPGSTGWMDISQNFTYGSVSDNDGALINGADDNSNLTGLGNSVHCITFGTESVANGEYAMIKILADESWTGYLSQLQFQLGASDAAAPTEAPALDDIDANNSGVSDAKLSFGTSNTIFGYSNATGSSISLTDFDSNDLYSLSGDRRGVFSSKPTLAGELNEDVGSNGDNYPANAFKDAFTGSLVLEVNGTEVHTVDLSSTLNAISNDFNANNSGFSVSAIGFSTTTDDIPDYTKPYRTGDYEIGADDQNIGWNYARVIHRIGSNDTVTNYVEWVTDTNSDALATGSLELTNFDHNDVYYQSGVRYFASRPSASLLYTAQNVYKNVYQNGTAVTFPTTTNCSVTNIRISGSGVSTQDSAASSVALPALNDTTNCEQQDIQVTGTILYDNQLSISGGLGVFTDYDVAVTSRIIHPLKSTLNTDSQSKTSFMFYSGSIGSTTTSSAEYFGLESYRILSGNYANQSDVTSSSNVWDSQNSVNDTGSYAAYADGMVSANGYLISPLQIGNAGDTRNVADGGSLQAPAGSPNYSSLDIATRTYYRHFVNDTGLAKATFKLKLYGDANLISKSGAFYTGSLGANKNITVELKVPFDPAFSGLDDTSTAWGDAIKPFSAGTQPDADGVGILNLGGSDLNQTVGGSGREIPIQLQGKQVRNTQYFVVKISAHEDWTGYLSRIEIDYS
jgi:hypothetical protein